MKRIIISNDNLPSKLPDILHIQLRQYTMLCVNDIVKMVNDSIGEKNKVIGIRTYEGKDRRLDLKLSNGMYKLNKLKVPIQMVVVMIDEKWEIKGDSQLRMEMFGLLEEIGVGGFSRVYLCERKYDKKLMTMKVVNKKEFLENGEVEMIKNEVEIHKGIKSSWIPKLYYCFEDKYNVYIVMEFCPNSDLFSQLKKVKRFNEDDAKVIFVQAVWCLTVLRDNGIIYRDIKTENFVIDQYGFLKLTDFGYAKKLKEGQQINGLCGSYEYMAPQMIMGKQYSYEYDIYSLVGKTPFSGIKRQQIKSLPSMKIEYPEYLSSPSINLISSLTHPSPQSRLGSKNIRQIFSHSWMPSPQTINNIINHKTSSPFIQITSLHPISTLPNLLDLSSTWNIHYNYFTPLDISINKIGPKLKTPNTKFQ